MSATFKDDEKEKYDENFKRDTNKIIDAFIAKERRIEEIECFNIANLNTILKILKSKLSSGQDKISNIMLKNINDKFKIVLLHLCKTTVKKINIPI